MADEDAPAPAAPEPEPVIAFPKPEPKAAPAPKPKPKRVKKPKPTTMILGDTTVAFVEDDAVVLYGVGRYRVHGHLRFAMTKDEAKALKKFLAKAL